MAVKIMTPAQLLKKLDATPPKVCQLSMGFIDDFATSANLTPYSCIKQKTCPICGNKGSTELYLGEDQMEFFYCDSNSGHVFSFDDDAGTADRVQM